MRRRSLTHGRDTRLGTVSVAAGTNKATVNITSLAVGSHTITAMYTGDGNYRPSAAKASAPGCGEEV
jgi:Bacterial Ig-like domain (group 3)